MYSFISESSEACEGEVPCPRTQHRNDVPIFWGDKHYISLKMLHQVGLETAREAATMAKIHAIAPRYDHCPSPHSHLNTVKLTI